HGRGFDKQYVTPDTGHGEPGRHARNGGANRRFVKELRASERVVHCSAIDRDGSRLISRRNAGGSLPEQRSEFTFQLTNASLSSVVGDDEPEHLVGHRDFLDTQTIPL